MVICVRVCAREMSQLRKQLELLAHLRQRPVTHQTAAQELCA